MPILEGVRIAENDLKDTNALLQEYIKYDEYRKNKLFSPFTNISVELLGIRLNHPSPFNPRLEPYQYIGIRLTFKADKDSHIPSIEKITL